MNLETAAYSAQSRQWPDQGRHILAQFDSDTIVVYQAYKPSIGRFAAAHGFFGGDWRPSRMTWIKPNFSLDDVPVRVGNKAGAGDHSCSQAQASSIRRDTRLGGIINLRVVSVRFDRQLEGSCEGVLGTLSVGS